MARLTRLERSIAGRVALVTGAASGMGRATAHLFADEGARVGVLDLDPQRVGAVVAEIESAGGVAEGFAMDVADAARVRALPDELAERLGPLDILVNNAGVVRGGPIEDPNYDEFWDFRIWIDVPRELAVARGIERDTEMEGREEAERLHRDRYQIGEQIYFSEVAPPARADMIIDNTDYAHPIVRGDRH